MKLEAIAFLLIFNCVSLFAQNLIQNGGFENLVEKIPNDANIFLDNFSNVKNWHYSGIHSTLVSKGQINNWEYITKGSVDPAEGNTFAGIYFAKRCPWNLDPKFDKQYFGCTSYIYSMLSQNIEAGDVITISYKIYIPYQTDIFEQDYLNHLGFTICQDCKPVISSSKGNSMLNLPFFKQNFVGFDKWYEVHQTIRTTCTLNTIIFGLFRSKTFPHIYGDGQQKEYGSPLFYIDDIKVFRDTTNTSQAEVGFCKYLKENLGAKESTIDSLLIHFQSSKSSILKEDEENLLRFIDTNLLNNYIFKIDGHTDATGVENYSLSKNRAQAVKNILQERFSISENQFIMNYHGESQPKCTNKGDSCKRINRRVLVQKILSNPAKIYFNDFIINLQHEKYESAFSSFTKWHKMNTNNETEWVLFNPLLNQFFNTERGLKFKRILKDKYQDFENPKLAFLLDSLNYIDQIGRMNRSTVFFDAEIKEHMPFLQSQPQNLAILSEKIFIKLKLICKNPPKIKEVGWKGVKCYTNIYLHNATAEELDKISLKVLEMVKIGEFDPEYYAMLVDKSLVNSNRPQKYGTQRPPNLEMTQQSFDELKYFFNRNRKTLGLVKLKK